MSDTLAPRCSKGWGGRCAASKGPRCKCRCGGHNHGNPKARPASKVETSDERSRIAIEYRMSEPPTRELLDEGRRLASLGAKIVFTRLAYDGPFPTANFVHPDRAVIEIVQPEGRSLLEQRYVYHSPTGMEFGYGGSGPSDTAINVLALVVPPKEACRLHQDFKSEFIARVSHDDGGEIAVAAVLDWVNARYALERADPELMRREQWFGLNDEAIRLCDEWEKLSLNKDGTERALTPSEKTEVSFIKARLASIEMQQKELNAAEAAGA